MVQIKMEKWSPIRTGTLILTVWLCDFSWAKCFLPNGTDRNDMPGIGPRDYLPCKPKANASMCCAIGRNTSQDVCLDSGLCYNEGSSKYWRESCTDPTWKSPECVKLFVNNSGASDDIELTQCNDGSWCEGSGDPGRACCGSAQGLFVVNSTVTEENPDPTASTSSSTASTSTASSTASASGASITGPAASSDDDSLTAGAKIGIGLGVGFGVILVGIMIAMLFLLRRRRVNQDEAMTYRTSSSGGTGLRYQASSASRHTDAASTAAFHSLPPEQSSQYSTSTKEKQGFVPYHPTIVRSPPVELASP